MKSNNHIDRENVQFEERILEQLSAFQVMKNLGFATACTMYPQHLDFLKEHIECTYQQVRQMFMEKLDTSIIVF